MSIRLAKDSTEHFLASIDWELLNTQKITLIQQIGQRAEYLEDQADTDPIIADLDGILNLLDALQDFAADEFGLTTHFPHCDVCGSASATVEWCGNCGCCKEHCQNDDGCEDA